MLKKHTHKSENIPIKIIFKSNNIPQNFIHTLFILTICLKKYLDNPFHTNNFFKSINSHKSYHTNPQINIITIKEHYENKTYFVIFVVINHIMRHKAKIYNQCTYTTIFIKKKIIII